MLVEKENGKKLWRPSLRGDTAKVRNILASVQVDVDYTVGKRGWTALNCAAYKGHKNVVRLLLDRGADLNKATNNGWTPLHCAACNGQKSVVRLLLDRGAREIEEGLFDFFYQKLQVAAWNGYRDITEFILERMKGPCWLWAKICDIMISYARLYHPTLC